MQIKEKVDEKTNRGTDQSVQHRNAGRFLVWENVQGAFSSNKGRDFAAVLTECVRVKVPEAPDIPVPEYGWPDAGVIMGDGFSIAWRIHDAQFWVSPKDGNASLWSPTTMDCLPQESCLSAILESEVDPKYFLSQRACLGILTRATRRGKELPMELREALLTQANMTEDQFVAYYQNLGAETPEE